MPSWQSRLFSSYCRVLIRRRDWGDAAALAARARRLFAMPPIMQRLALRGMACDVVRDDSRGVRGEWVATRTTGSGRGRGIVLYVHGGGYVSGTAVHRRPLTAAIARLTNRPVFSADYRLAPESPFPAAFDDVVATYRWLLEVAAPGEPIVVAGESAGGGVILALAQHVGDAGWPAPAGIVALSPWADLTRDPGDRHANDGRCAMFHPQNTRAFADAYLAGHDDSDPRASPLCGTFGDLPPLLIQVGSTELLFDDARAVHDAVIAAGGASTLRVYDDVAHAWQLTVPFIPEATRAVEEIAAFVVARLALPDGLATTSAQVRDLRARP